jgi:hypothetical protein
MNPVETNIKWEDEAYRKYELMISKIPLFHREIAKQVVNKKAIINAVERGSSKVEEGDIIRAFLSEVPHTFYSLMVRLFEEVGFDFKKYAPRN